MEAEKQPEIEKLKLEDNGDGAHSLDEKLNECEFSFVSFIIRTGLENGDPLNLSLLVCHYV